jgi:hypothetical protein
LMGATPVGQAPVPFTLIIRKACIDLIEAPIGDFGGFDDTARFSTSVEHNPALARRRGVRFVFRAASCGLDPLDYKLEQLVCKCGAIAEGECSKVLIRFGDWLAHDGANQPNWPNPACKYVVSRWRSRSAATARGLNLVVQAFEARSASGIDEAFAAMANDHWQGVLILSDVLMVFNEKKLAELALQDRLPAIFGFREFADMGGLASYGANLGKQYRRAAWCVSKIVTGADPADLPIEQPTRFGLVINLKTAKALGLTVPQSMLLLADESIE